MNDNIINAYCDLLRADLPKDGSVVLLSTQGHHVLKRHRDAAGHQYASRVRQLIAKRQDTGAKSRSRKVHAAAIRVILVPINVCGSHWAYINVNVANRYGPWCRVLCGLLSRWGGTAPDAAGGGGTRRHADSCSCAPSHALRSRTMTYVDSSPGVAYPGEFTVGDPDYQLDALEEQTKTWLDALGLPPSDAAWTFKDEAVSNQGNTLACGAHMCVHINTDSQAATGAKQVCRRNVTEANANLVRRIIARDIIEGSATRL